MVRVESKSSLHIAYSPTRTTSTLASTNAPSISGLQGLLHALLCLLPRRLLRLFFQDPSTLLGFWFLPACFFQGKLCFRMALSQRLLLIYQFIGIHINFFEFWLPTSNDFVLSFFLLVSALPVIGSTPFTEGK